ncbi:MAG: carboxymuconolactone decarboxylase family protein [Capsulimonadales bacterium]|nr:carboxymuconolactone decarboxylase family protein [Capsulimonadales bacterium]
MQRLTSVEPAQATGEARELLDATQAKMKMVPNLVKTMANSPAALKGYLALSDALGHGRLPAKFRERLALMIAESNGCGYCASAHTAIGKMVGLNDAELLDARNGQASDAKMAAALTFAREVLEHRGQVRDAALDQVRQAGYTDGDIAEIVAHVALNVFTNYLNNVAQTEIDFPKVDLLNGKGE